jgi:hypothetical protein
MKPSREISGSLEAQYLESDEFQAAYETWQRDSLAEFQPVRGSVLDTFLRTNEYREGLNAYLEIWFSK